MKCPNCGADNPDGSIFCGDCGTPLAGSAPEPEAPVLPVAAQALVRCPDCGAENPAGAVFCSTCRGVLGPAPADAPSGPAPGGDLRAQLPTRCPSCGGPVYPGQARCRRCGANPIAEAHYEATMEPKDAQGPILDEDRPVNRRGELRMPDLDDVLDVVLGLLLKR